MPQRFLVSSAVLLILIASQIFWVQQVRNWVKSLIPSPTWRRRVGIVGWASYILLIAYNFLPAWMGFVFSRASTAVSSQRPVRARFNLLAILFQTHFWGWIRGAPSTEPTHLTFRAALIQAPFWWWIVCSVLGFLIAIIFGLADRIGRAARWVYRRVAEAGRAAAAAQSCIAGAPSLP